MRDHAHTLSDFLVPTLSYAQMIAEREAAILTRDAALAERALALKCLLALATALDAGAARYRTPAKTNAFGEPL